MKNLLTFKRYFSKVDQHLCFEFYSTKECLKVSTELPIDPKADTLFGLVAGEQHELNIVELLYKTEINEHIIIENKDSLIEQAKEYICQHIHPASIINYAVFDHLRYYTPAKYTHTMIKDLCDNKLIVNLSGLKQPLQHIDEQSLFAQVSKDYRINQNKIIHADELVSLL